MAKLNRTVVEISESVLYTDTSAKDLFALPKGAVPLFAIVQVKTAFNASTSNVLSIGTPTSASYFASGIPLGTVGAVMVALNHADDLDRKQGITATYTGTGDAATTGRAIVRIVYSTPFRPV